LQPVIMVIDDDNTITELLATVIEKYGFTPITASNGRAALDILDQIPPPVLIITDYSMPLLNGRELILALSLKPGYEQIPVVMITGSSAQDLQLPNTCNFEGVILKPFDLATIAGIIMKYTGGDKSYHLA